MCCAKQERNELIRELQEIGCKEFIINNILNTKQGSGEIIRSVLKFIKHSGFRTEIASHSNTGGGGMRLANKAIEEEDLRK